VDKEGQMKNVVVLSCWFGHQFNKPIKINSFSTFKRWLYATIKNNLPFKILDLLGFDSLIPESPLGIERCYFYSNNIKLKAEVLYKGWCFCFVKSVVENGESIASSLLAKKVKFLQVEDFYSSKFDNVDHLIYMDSRRISDDIANIIQRNQKGILVRYEAKLKPSIWHEVDEAKGQERYAKHMAKTIDFIDSKLAEGYSADYRVMNTGIIAYSMKSLAIKKKITSLCDEVYNACVTLKQPECLILWCLLSQSYMNIIKAEEYSEIKSRSGL
jgi:hypothetical protein